MKALLIVDMLKDFVYDSGALKVNGAQEIIPFVRDLREDFKNNNEPVIYICDNHSKDDPEFKVWPPHCVEGTTGAEVINELKPDDTDYIVKKTTYSGFFRTNLNELLKSLNIDTVYVVGVAMNICVHYTAADAKMLGYNVFVPLRGVRGLTREDEEYMEKQFRNVLNLFLI
jgi:nicotinamidase-related amidase